MYKRMALANLRNAIKRKKEIMSNPLWFINPKNWIEIIYLNHTIKELYKYYLKYARKYKRYYSPLILKYKVIYCVDEFPNV